MDLSPSWHTVEQANNLIQNSLSPMLYQFCQLGHLLTWKSQNINQCGMCGVPKISQSRYKCSLCNVNFCVKCVVPPIFGTECGAGHQMVLSKVPYHMCDLCGETIIQMAYRCKSCDFDICEKCRVEKED